jgi:hypothetical protein
LQLNQCAWTLGQRLCKIEKIFTIRWVASSLKTEKAVWDGYRPPENHFTEAATDATRDSKERGKYKGLCNILTSCEFIRNSGTMYDALTELSELSLLLQNREMTLPDADRAIKGTIRVLESMSSSPGPYAAETNSAVEAKVSKEIQLHSNRKVVEIHSGRFFRSTVENLRQRLVQNVSQASLELKALGKWRCLQGPEFKYFHL